MSVDMSRAAHQRDVEWDSRLDDMLQDLERSAQQGRSYQVQKNFVYNQQSSYSTSSGAKSSFNPLVKSQSSGSVNESAGTMLKDLDTALKASSNYIETHRSVSGPEGTREFHEVRSYSSGGDHAGRAPEAGDFNLERQVQHMIPLTTSSSLDRNYSALQSANMVSSVQQQRTFTTYKVQSNQYTSSGKQQMVPVDYPEDDRPGSRLKQNIDELDTLLSDLNNARGNRANGQPSYQPPAGGASSDDYSLSDSGLQGHVKKTVSSFNEYNYQTSSTSGQHGDAYSRKPPSPQGRRRASPGPAIQPSPAMARRTSPGPAGTVSSTYKYDYSHQATTTNSQGSDFNSSGQDYRSDYHPSRPEHRSPGPDYGSSGPTYRSPSPYSPPSDMRRSSPSPSGPRVPRDGTPTGASYYSKYHSSHTHQSQKTSSGPMAFPASPAPHHGSQTIQTPPKRVDELMSELADFDPSIKPSDIAEPVPSRARGRHTETVVTETRSSEDHDYPSGLRHRRSPSPVRPSKQSSTPGPPVYYPPGEVFSSTKSQTGSLAPAPASAQQSLAVEGGKGKGKAQMKREYGYKEKGKYSESDSKGGAAVVPICLPLCCAAPCVIL